MVRLAAATACLVMLLAGCGADDDDDAGGAAVPPQAELTVTARPSGPDGPVRERRVECERVGPGASDRVCRGLTTARLAPVAPVTACAEIYGGPATARVTGTLRGERVDARFSRVDACQIERWDRNAALLGEAAPPLGQ